MSDFDLRILRGPAFHSRLEPTKILSFFLFSELKPFLLKQNYLNLIYFSILLFFCLLLHHSFKIFLSFPFVLKLMSSIYRNFYHTHFTASSVENVFHLWIFSFCYPVNTKRSKPIHIIRNTIQFKDKKSRLQYGALVIGQQFLFKQATYVFLVYDIYSSRYVALILIPF